MKVKSEHTLSCGNVFADLGLPNADERMMRAQLAVQIRRFIGDKRWTQTESAEAIGLGQMEVSDLLSIASDTPVEVFISAGEVGLGEAQTTVTVG